MLLWGEGEDGDGKAKNIKHTEILVNLREAILQVARHFQSLDPKNNKVVSPMLQHKFRSVWVWFDLSNSKILIRKRNIFAIHYDHHWC